MLPMVADGSPCDNHGIVLGQQCAVLGARISAPLPKQQTPPSPLCRFSEGEPSLQGVLMTMSKPTLVKPVEDKPVEDKPLADEPVEDAA